MARIILLKPKLKVYILIKSIQFGKRLLNAYYVPGIRQCAAREEIRYLRHKTASPGTHNVVDPCHLFIPYHWK